MMTAHADADVNAEDDADVNTEDDAVMLSMML